MQTNEQFRPEWASAPGETIADILRERQISLKEFARSMDEPPEHLTDLLEGRATITLGLARKLERVLGGSVEFWMSRDFQYRQDIARLHVDHEEWLSELPIGDMIKFGWLTPVPLPSDEVSACLRFFDVPSVPAWREVYVKLLEMV